MEMRHLRYFTAAAEELNISRASRRLNVSQPAMSRLIHDLEEELGTVLFVRERFGLKLTATGEKLLVYTHQIIDITNEAVRVVGNMPGTSLHIGFVALSISSFLGIALRTFRDANPGVIVKIHELPPAAQILALRKKQIDIALIDNSCGFVPIDDFDTTVLFEKQLMAAIQETHHLASQRLMSLKDLENEDFVGYSEESFPGRNQAISHACEEVGFKPNFLHQGDSLGEVLAMIGSGSGVCLIPTDVVSKPYPGVKFIKIKEELAPIHFAAVRRQGDNRSIIASLLEHAKRQYSK
jgi:DNA-binding transcriptional LysR family regulator